MTVSFCKGKSIRELLEAIDKDFDKINSYLLEYYKACPELRDKFYAHNDPRSNIMCLLNHTIHRVNELGRRCHLDEGGQFELFTIAELEMENDN